MARNEKNVSYVRTWLNVDALLAVVVYRDVICGTSHQVVYTLPRACLGGVPELFQLGSVGIGSSNDEAFDAGSGLS